MYMNLESDMGHFNLNHKWQLGLYAPQGVEMAME